MQEWNEEDDLMLQRIIQDLVSLSYEYKVDFNDKLNWLKSLKPQTHWRPSEEQMEALRKVAFKSGNSCLSPYSDKDKELVLLYNELKTL